MVRTQIQLTEQQSKMLKALALEENVSVAELIRRSIEQYLRGKQLRDREELKQNTLRVIGKYGSGYEDIATNHDAHLADIYAEVGQ